MTTACGSTISSQDSQKTLSFEEAPFREYLKILRTEGFNDEADSIEDDFKQIFIDLQYTEEQLYETPFQNVKQVVEVYINELNNQLEAVVTRPQPQHMSVNGTMLAGEGAKELTPDSLMMLAQRQQQLMEEEKLKKQMM